MRIAQINMLHYGSTGKIMLGIADCTRSSGMHAATFSPEIYLRNGSMEKPAIDGHSYFGSRWENMLHHFGCRVTSLNGFGSVLGTRRLLKQLEQFRPDIVHLHNLHNGSICLPMLFGYLKKKKIKVVWTLHDCWAMTGKCAHFVTAKCEKWKTGCHHCSQLHAYPAGCLDTSKFMWKRKQKWFTSIPDMTLAAPSRWLAELAEASFLGKYPVRVIPNGIDLGVFQPTQSNFRKEYGCEGKKIVLGVAFGWGHAKGLDVFIELAKQLPQDYQIVLVGTSEKTDAQLPENIISIHRTQNQQQLAEIYTAADVFVNPTREDTFPTVNMEALACGTPVVTFRTGGSPEIPDETCGTVVDCEDVPAMAAAICQVCQEHIYSAQACLARAARFDRNEKFKEYVALYEERMKT